MQLTEAVKKLLGGQSHLFSTEPGDDNTFGILVESFLDVKGNNAVSHPGLESFLSYLSYEADPTLLHLLNWDSDSSSHIAEALESSSGHKVLLRLPKSSKGSQVSTIKSLSVRVERDEDAGEESWVLRGMVAAGLQAGNGVAVFLRAHTHGDAMMLRNALAAIRLYLGDNDNSVSADTARKVLGSQVKSDGRACLDDLLFQRASTLLPRIEAIGVSNLVGLFRSAAEELVRAKLVYTLEESGKTVDQIIMELAGSYSSAAIKNQYIRLGRNLKQGRMQRMLDKVLVAEGLMMSTRQDKMLVAKAMALSICRI